MAQEVVILTESTSYEEADDDLEECASDSIVVSPNLHELEFEGAATSASGLSSSPYFSPRIQDLSELINDFDSKLEFEIESSKSHWTDLSVSSSNSDGGDEQVSNSQAFERLKEHPEWGVFFRREPYDLEIGEKIAEGGQAKIFGARRTTPHDRKEEKHPDRKRELVVKVFRSGFPLQDLQRLWPPGLAAAALPFRYFGRDYAGSEQHGLCFARGAQMLKDGRFAFVFDRYWGDLRKCIDMRMLKSNGTRPFILKETLAILLNIAGGMAMLHKFGLLHRDLKAANVLMSSSVLDFRYHYIRRCAAHIADFESSVGVVGTGFWRAPEILRAQRERSLKPEIFTQQTDVYGYAMTCYEVITGREPFEGHRLNDYDIVLRGDRPTLPEDICPELKNLVSKCWHEDPRQRPSFVEILDLLKLGPKYPDISSLLTPKRPKSI